MPLDELTIINDFLRPLAGEGAFGFRDDAGCVASASDEDLVVTTDMIAVGVHFLPDDPPDCVARKALRVNVSDLAAKGATPAAYLLSAAFPRDLDAGWLSAFCDGLRRDQEEFGLSFLGGDTISIGHGPVLSVTAIGRVPKGRMVHRFTARPGDALYVSGTIGDSATGLALLKGESGPWTSASAAEKAMLVARYRVPEPRVGLVPALLAHASAAMDLSDGLIGDGDKMVESSGVSAWIDADKVPLSPALADADEAMLARLVSGGDDYEILAAVPPAAEAGYVSDAAAAGIAVTRIGEVKPGAGPVEVRLRGRPMRLGTRAYVHGRGGTQE